MTELLVETPHGVVTMRPQFSHDEKGFLFTGCQTQMKGPRGSAEIPGSTIKVDHRQTDGLYLPYKLTVTMSLPAGTQEIPFRFEGYEVNKHDGLR